MNSNTHDLVHLVTTLPERSQNECAPGPPPNEIIVEIAKAIARRLAREEYNRRRLVEAGADAEVFAENPDRK